MIVVFKKETLRYGSGGAGLYPRVDPLTALTKRFDFDAMIWPGEIMGPSGPENPIALLPKAAAAGMIEAGFQPVITHAFIDYDNPSHENWAAKEQAAAFIARIPRVGPLAQAGFYSTNAGVRLVWELASPVPVFQWSSYFHALAALVMKATGWGWAAKKGAKDSDGAGGIDRTGDEWTRVLRAPYATRDGVPLDPILELGAMTPLEFDPAIANRAVPVPFTVEIPEDIPELKEVPDTLWSKILMAPVAGQYFEQLKTGKPLTSTKGKRHPTMIRVISSVAAALDDGDPDQIWNVVGPAVLAGSAYEGAPTAREAWKWVCHNAAERAQLIQSRENAATYPPIVFAGKNYYILEEATRTYRPPVAPAAICAMLERYAPTAAAGGIRTEKGKPRGESEYIADFGRPIQRVIVTLGSPGTRFDPATGTLFEGVCAPLEIEGEYDPDVAEWLDAYIGDERAIYDWIATLTVLDRPTTAMYFEGDASVGKGLFAGAMSGVFGATTPTDYMEATGGSWNDALTRSPIVYLDEGLDGNAARNGFTASFRKLIGDDSRPLRRRFVDSGTLIGCPRLIIAANNEDALRIREKQTSADLEALAQRLFFHRVPKKAGNILVKLGSRSGTADWLRGEANTPGRAVRHVVRLIKEGRDAALAKSYGSRWIVAGERKEFHEGLALSNDDTLSTLGVVCRALAANNPCATWIDGAIKVHVPSLSRAWPGLTDRERARTDSEISTALRGVGAMVAEGRRRFVILDLRTLQKAAYLLGFDQIVPPAVDVNRAPV